MSFIKILAIVLFSFSAWSQHYGELKLSSDYVSLSPVKGISCEVRYATKNNFTGENLYGTFAKPYLHKVAAAKLFNAVEILQKEKPGWNLLVFDGLRPRSVQKKMWNKVKGTMARKYVANPDKGSVHNYGFAVDLSLLDDHGKEVDMGTPYDSFQELAQPELEEKFLEAGKLTEEQVANRKILRSVMTQAGFVQLPIEWWHFDALPTQELKKHYKIVE